MCDAGENFPLHGLIKRTQLLRMLKHRIGMFPHDGMSPLAPSKTRIPKTQVSSHPADMPSLCPVYL